ncbi:MAG: glycosyltransferase [Steroidobacteraceae bacterium]|nr:glycosyltransferase [Steroidobacteraceae bacterium]
MTSACTDDAFTETALPGPAQERPGQADRPTVVVYTHSLLEPSMTFILSHAQALRRYEPVFAGAHRVQGLALPADRVVTANRGGLTGRIEEFLFRQYGIAPCFVRDLRRFEPKLVHAHFGQSGPGALTLAEALGVPLVLTYHGQDATITEAQARRTWRGREYLRGRARVMDRAGLIIAVSDFIRGRLVAKGYPEHKVVTFRNGIDVGLFQRSVAPREPVAVFIGRFVEKKGGEYLLRALGRLRAQGRGVRGVLIGDGPLRPALESLAREVGADAEFTGFLAPARVRERIGRASVVVVPSVTAADGDSEGLPTVILEAQAMGTPVVATRHAGNAEGVREGRSALLVDERDVPALADAIHYFIEHPESVASFGAAGRAFVETNFDIEQQAVGLERLYDRTRQQAEDAAHGGVACRA